MTKHNNFHDDSNMFTQCPYCGRWLAYIRHSYGSYYQLVCFKCGFNAPKASGSPNEAQKAFDDMIERVVNYNPENYAGSEPSLAEAKFFWRFGTETTKQMVFEYGDFSGGHICKEEAIESARQRMQPGQYFEIEELSESEFDSILHGVNVR